MVDVEDSAHTAEQNWTPKVKSPLVDDGRSRLRMDEPLRHYLSLVPSGLPLSEEHATSPVKSNKRKRSKGKKNVSEQPKKRGKNRPREPSAPSDRPQLEWVGDAEFISIPPCSKIVTTIRVVTVGNAPGPLRSYYQFPIDARIKILREFLQRYSWKEGAEDDYIKTCADVFERIAYECYQRQMTTVRAEYTRDYGKDMQKWKEIPPEWCKNEEHWQGLIAIWETDG